MPRIYGSNLLDFEKRFGSEEALRAYLVAVRWPAGFRCPRGRGDRAWPRRAGGLIERARCRYKASATARTIFDQTRRGKLFYRLVQQAVEVDPVHWRDVAAAARDHNHNL